MSRGLGRVERRILELLEGTDSLPAGKIAWMIAGQAKPTLALAASVRRAVSGLQKKGRLVRVQGRAWMLEEKWRRGEDRPKREDAACRENMGRNRAWQEARVREKAEAESRSRKEDNRHGSAVGSTPHKTDFATGAARLVKVLGLFASAHDGEVLSAARQAEQIRRRLGCGWDELIIAHNVFGSPATPLGGEASSSNQRKQDDVDRAVDAFQQAMSESSFRNWR
jgi:hypothetical protein